MYVHVPVSTLAVTLETSTLEVLTRGALTGGPGVRLFWGRWPGLAILLTGANIPGKGSDVNCKTQLNPLE